MENKKHIIILGAAESGVGAAILAQKQGFEVFVSDNGKIQDEYRELLLQHNIPFEEGQHSENKILTANEIIKSPVIPDNVPLLLKVKEKGIPVISEIEFAGRYTKAKKICITGSNGKTTTTMLIYHILKNAGYNVALAGNVGKSFALQVAEETAPQVPAPPSPPEGGDVRVQATDNENCITPTTNKYECNIENSTYPTSPPSGGLGGAGTGVHDYYVLELSSFQLDGMYNFKADIAIITNITPDHLDRYDYNFQNYIDSKFRILQNQTKNDYFIFWSNDPVIITEIEKRDISAKKIPFNLEEITKYELKIANVKDAVYQKSIDNYAFTENNCLNFLEIKNQKSKIKNTFMAMELDNLSIKGVHNLYNSMAAGLAAQIVNIRSEKIRNALETFEGVEHRMEYVASVRGVRYINDSKATNVNSTWYALESMQTPVVLILGGTDKGNDYSEIDKLVRQKVHTLVFLGEDNSKLKKFFAKQNFVEAKSMSEAVTLAYQAAKHGDTVLLSPCCASFDLFKNYEDRGKQFKECVLNL